MRSLFYKTGHFVLSIYWKVFRPKTFGVKALIVNMDNPHEFLCIKTSYGLTDMWQLPGGGYNPKKETAQSAIVREIKEELGLEIAKPEEIGEYKTSGEGKQDTVKIFKVGVTKEQIGLTSGEVSEVAWLHRDGLKQDEVTKITRYALGF